MSIVSRSSRFTGVPRAILARAFATPRPLTSRHSTPPHATPSLSLSHTHPSSRSFARRWFFREVKDRAPPRMPKVGELRRPIDTTTMGTNRSREAHKAEEEGKLRRKQSMLGRAGKRLAYEDGHDQTVAASQRV